MFLDVDMIGINHGKFVSKPRR